MTIFHHKLLTREGRVLANGWPHPPSMIVFVNYPQEVEYEKLPSDINYHMILNSIFSIQKEEQTCCSIDSLLWCCKTRQQDILRGFYYVVMCNQSWASEIGMCGCIGHGLVDILG